MIPVLANILWSAANLPSYLRFRRALREPHAAQERKLRAWLQRHRGTAFGKAHGLSGVCGYDVFTRRVPLAGADAFEPWIARIRRGEVNVLTPGSVTHLVPTSGSTGARKLIPFSSGLQREFSAAVGPWLVDWQRQSPGLLGGPAYWSVTPPLGEGSEEDSVVPVGFDSDAAYLGGARRWLAQAAMAVPPGVPRAGSLEDFRHETLLHLLRCRSLRLMSVWHPSFLGLLMDALPTHWDRLLEDLAGGRGKARLASPVRLAELRRLGPHHPAFLWPELRAISCWGEGAAGMAAADLQRRFPGVELQAKGLMATEAVVTLPFGGQHPLAVESHFFEFIDEAGGAHPVEALREGHDYEVAVTTAGGLARYRLGDRVRVSGWVEKTPSLTFLGRADNVSDRRGEKLSEACVIDALQCLFGPQPPRFAMLAPNEEESACRYTLYVEGQARPEWASMLDAQLRRNPHYACCRDLGQLLPLDLFVIAERGFETFAQRMAAPGARLGDVKPAALSRISGWSKIFAGERQEKPG